MRFPEENLLATIPEGDGFFVASPGALLKAGRYSIIRKLGRGVCSNTFLVEDLQPKSLSSKYLAAKILTVASTAALEKGSIHEPEFLQAVAHRRKSTPVPSLPVLEDHFAQRGLHGIHYCLLTAPLRSDVHAFRTSAASGKLAVHVVKPIIACVVEGLKALHSLNIIHADVKADNVLFLGPDTAEIEETIAREPPLVDGTFEFRGTQYPILRSQPFQPGISWDVSSFDAETIQVVLSDLGAALWADKPKPPGDIGAFALRAPENIIRAECGKEIDIWAVGCMTFELLTGQILFRPQPTTDLTADESLLLLQYALTGETLDKSLAEQSRAKDQYFDNEGDFVKAKANPYPRQTLKELLTEHTELTAIQVEAAARFIGDCLRLDPGDRLSIEQLDQHQWLETAFMGGMDEAEQPPHSDAAPESQRQPAL
ncbi:kinase-like protein [Laetiporus sulphureus 93-53]|uniref:non-specific serine/threonine protein kinase n=1 Tax=Laetiporus sulphureus 93-53 TaxID=1314785 RepID=A0A165ER99_9APHY|nr:kinase-like protein [Laetiporus sulphureus 93-53]KZT07598.1 kinase-like protein [Laetiporus sulphureus 93-53]